eukprot:361367-Chlamydomonas_euryale.AAC.8
MVGLEDPRSNMEALPRLCSLTTCGNCCLGCGTSGVTGASVSRNPTASVPSQPARLMSSSSESERARFVHCGCTHKDSAGGADTGTTAAATAALRRQTVSAPTQRGAASGMLAATSQRGLLEDLERRQPHTSVIHAHHAQIAVEERCWRHRAQVKAQRFEQSQLHAAQLARRVDASRHFCHLRACGRVDLLVLGRQPEACHSQQLQLAARHCLRYEEAVKVVYSEEERVARLAQLVCHLVHPVYQQCSHRAGGVDLHCPDSGRRCLKRGLRGADVWRW